MAHYFLYLGFAEDSAELPPPLSLPKLTAITSEETNWTRSEQITEMLTFVRKQTITPQ